MTRARDSPPRLSDAVVAKAMEGILRRGYVRLLGRRVLRRQEHLKKLVPTATWQAYLLLEQDSNERWLAALTRAARWGYRAAGRKRRSARRRRG